MSHIDKYRGFIGTYTKGESEGIYTFLFDAESGQISEVKPAAKLNNPTYLAISKDNNYLYSIVQDGTQGGVAAFSLNSTTGELQLLNQQLTEGPQPCHVQLDSENHYLLAANYHRGTITAYTINAANREVNRQPSVIEHKGKAPVQKPHTHYATFTPDGRFVAVVDLGIDQLLTYEIVEDHLQKVSQLDLTPGSGPRHLDFHPNGKYAYIMTEYSSEVVVLQYHAETGTFTELQSITTIPADFTENNQGSAIHITSDGRYLYAGNRGHNSIAVFAAAETSGRLTFVEHVSSAGDWPRDFALDPTEKYMIGSNQESENIVIYRRDLESGRLSLLQSDIHVPHPICIKFLNETL
ncbi:lactonase family protein [Bacillus benzoevorans]|uniref:6-phosphogluconolactonase n=1 Tax=Bacillus benzoevorans TaxID=1456 RepID=A0A7X0HM99_9BACI|nr:lactonase family protein [Bacillus benzoevorans]MBB6443430.1 6-phosphogluconolactonase [Bacillus benzoevorans]